MSLSSILGITKPNILKLQKLGIESIDDLMNFFPQRHVDLEKLSNLKECYDGQFVVLALSIKSVGKPFQKGALEVFSARGVTDAGECVKIVWFNANYNAKYIVENCRISCFGKIKKEDGRYLLTNPIYDGTTGLFSSFKGIRPIYPVRGIMSQTAIIAIIKAVLTDYVAKSIISDEIEKKYGIFDLTRAYQMIHQPEFVSDIKNAEIRISIEELVKRVCAYRFIREDEIKQKGYDGDTRVIDDIIKSLPYTLTPSQNTAIERILSTMNSSHCLNAMLAGDVGSGKTIVALIIAYYVTNSRRQVAVLAPTEILAQQHKSVFEEILSPFGVRVELLTAALSKKTKKELIGDISTGKIQIVIGTHAIISRSVEFNDLAFVIIDEQHRFGVAQRTALIEKNGSPDILTLSATPIPRSLRLAMFGDIDLINIERRHDASNIITAIVPQIKKDAMIEYVIEECRGGKQAYFVAPRIYDDEGIPGDSAEKIYAETLEKTKGSVEVAILHGECKSDEKNKILEAFRLNEISILVSTSIIEVGIDVPNTSLMVIFDAEKFGLSTLHQLRGRIGRNGLKAYCFLYSQKAEEEELTRLKVLVEERDGLKIAEKDYAMRGAGDWIGESQSGKSRFRPTLNTVRIVKRISEEIDVEKYRAEIIAYGEKKSLKRVTLT
ncbi:MAG: DEAD/DEAH box helicase [Christensenellaceae bacterium]|jgi:ATP-dependent DNA helicase RecG|nr:DEAD/DEAH box helicase [Christensenellaceae bacterium]